MTRQILFLVPLTLILPEVLPGILPMFDGLDAVYMAVPCSDFLAIFTVGAFVLVELHRLNKRIAESKSAAQPVANEQGAQQQE